MIVQVQATKTLLALTLNKLERGLVKQADFAPIGSKNVFSSDSSVYYYKLGDRYLHEVKL